MTSNSSSKLGDSWINETETDGNISWVEDTEPSDTDDMIHAQNQRISPAQRKSLLRVKSSPRTTTSTQDLEFVMPTMRDSGHSPESSMPKHTLQPAIPMRETRYPSQKIKQPISADNRRSRQPAGDKAHDMIVGTVGYVLDILISTLRTLKQPISWVLAAYLFAGLLVLMQNLLTTTIWSALSPVCRIPGASLLRLPMCNSPYTSPEQPTISSSSSGLAKPEFDTLMTIQGKFETVLKDSTASVALPFEMKRSEGSIRDLRTGVRFSTVPSKNELLHELDEIIPTARKASYALMRFHSHVGHGVDLVLSTARWTQRILDDISHKNSQSSGFVADFINNKLLAPFQPLQFTESRVLDQFITHTRLILGEIEKLTTEAEALLSILTDMEDRLDAIHAVCLRDNLAAESSRDEILSELWTFLGGNRARLGKVSKQLRLLASVGEYRKLAYAHVADTILKLQAMSAELEELKTRVGSAAAVEDLGIQGVPLSVHIENIRLGVERLESQRKKAREVQEAHVQRMLDVAGWSGEEKRMMIEA